MSVIRYTSKKHSGEEGHFWISISDLMTSLLFVFILILAYMILDYEDKHTELDKKIEMYKENVATRRELLKTLQSRLRNKGVEVEVDLEEGAMRITRERLFDSAKADIRKNKVWIIREVSQELLQLMLQSKFRDAINTIFIEGHTDNLKLDKGKYGFRWTNMELSAQRAINTFLLMDKLTGGKFSELKNRRGDAMISYSGYADTRPIKGVSNDTPEGRERNRRIQFFFAVNPPALEKIGHESRTPKDH